MTTIKTQFFTEHDRWILWIPVIFGVGIIFYFSNPNKSFILALALFFFSIFLIYLFSESLLKLVFIGFATFFLGFLWTKIFTEKIIKTPKIEYKFYATAIGKIDQINVFYNPLLKRNAYQIVLENLQIYKAGSIAGDVLVKKDKPEKLSSRKPKKESLTKKSTIQKKPKKLTKTIIKNYLNVADYQEIDRGFLHIDYKSQDRNWLENRYINPPEKVILNVNTKLNDAKIGDIIQTRVVLEPFSKPYLEGKYDKSFENYFKQIGASGYAASDLKIIKIANKNGFLESVEILRQKIARKILDQTDKNQGTIAVALLVGVQNLIPPQIGQDLRNSGLYHLISISGLHFTLAAGIFFFSIRFLLSLNQFLVLNYDIKKIAALIAIFAGGFYLLLAGSPIPAIRAFIIITLIFIAILLDLKPNAFRSCAFAALAILICSPNVIYSVSFQLSFAAILALISLADYIKKFDLNSSDRSIFFKFCFYFISIIFSSLAATIATTPFSIYHFNNFISYGFLANLAAIPIASFVVMPFGFLALILMPFGIEKIAIYPMQIGIDWIIQISEFIANLPESYFAVKSISQASFGLIIFGGLWFLIWQKSWRFLGILPIIIGIYFGYKTPIPKFLIDEERKVFAFYYNQKLIFAKPAKSNQARVWAKSLGLEEYYSIDDLSYDEKQDLRMNCEDGFCKFVFDGSRILVLKGRNKNSEACDQEYDLVVNLNRKYLVPDCL